MLNAIVKKLPQPVRVAVSEQLKKTLIFRTPRAEDGPAVWRLISACPPLEPNSLYCNLLQCTHFAGTCILAEQNGEIVGWISGHRPPEQPGSMFVWQVAVHESMRGQGLGQFMLDALFQLPYVRGAVRLITTVTPSNLASRRMFERFARRHGGELKARLHFKTDVHFGGAHESEELISIGPVNPAKFRPDNSRMRKKHDNSAITVRPET